ncbi:DUF3488 domain-containing protein, partial [Weissella cibaria]|uniref:DUF3488 domain-containing protein n=1 Tax=Weissella cibaria TaxID=137591 RepID=UPI00143FA66E
DLDDTAVAPGRPLPWRALYETEGEPLRYRVIMEPTDQRWLFALDLAEPVEAEIGMTRDYRLLARRPVSQPFAYRVSSWPRYRMDTGLPRWLVMRNLQLPEGGNPRTRALVAELRSRADGPQAFVQATLAHFASGGYRYTLTP